MHTETNDEGRTREQDELFAFVHLLSPARDLPRQLLAFKVGKRARVFQRRVFDNLGEASDALFGCDHAVVARHLGRDVARMEQQYSDLFGLEIDRKARTDHVERRLGCTVAVVPARRVVGDASHTRRKLHDKCLALRCDRGLEIGQHRTRHEKRADGVDLKLAQQVGLVRRREILGSEYARIVQEQIHGHFVQRRGDVQNRLLVRRVQRQQLPRLQRLQLPVFESTVQGLRKI
jgi:hypothetical protein